MSTAFNVSVSNLQFHVSVTSWTKPLFKWLCNDAVYDIIALFKRTLVLSVLNSIDLLPVKNICQQIAWKDQV